MGGLSIEVVYALPSGEDAVTLTLAAGATVAEAVRASGVLERHPEIDLGRHRIGIFGRVVVAQAPLRDGDRVEIYRPLTIDAKEARRRRAFKRR
jgi:putative ubiquitin-RnfH superfamily antitoxin RatB of RatAB toxin-antitoxin module